MSSGTPGRKIFTSVSTAKSPSTGVRPNATDTSTEEPVTSIFAFFASRLSAPWAARARRNHCSKLIPGASDGLAAASGSDVAHPRGSGLLAMMRAGKVASASTR
ncbi:hypothetical protein [Sorangium sp. So ce388]|uniref:hypothetical protein n=1 Tax=Sorangium sp. So ce388 TaxID=3133309 RepID=UPI003F5C51CC